MARVSQWLRRLVWFRLMFFVSIFIPLGVFGLASATALIFSFLSIAVFLLLVRWNGKLEQKKRKYAELIELLKREVGALDHRFSSFENGEKYKDADHSFSYDLDLFGEGSLFQFINRTTTVGGSDKLAHWFTSPPVDKSLIEARQKAVKELSGLPNWRLHFLATGNLFRETEREHKEILQWSELELHLKNPKQIAVLVRVLPVATVAALVFWGFTGSGLFAILLVLLQWIMMYAFWGKINQFYGYFGRKVDLLEKYMHLLDFAEKRNFKDPYLQALRKKLLKPSSVSQLFGRLKSLVKEIGYRQNLLVGIVLNSVFLWDIRCVYRLWGWHGGNRKKIKEWLDAIAELDALISIAGVAYNYPDLKYPIIHDEGFTFQALKLGHPLIEPKRRVCNDMTINGWGKVEIVTGANMAGKSTFLRTVGVNLVLGRIGSPVCAERLMFRPVALFTNMRTTDSLLKDESYFFAELKRLKLVLDRLKEGERIMVILDEVLKGTNSLDKLNGSKELIKKMLELKAVALIATHDLKLSEMEDRYPQQVFNKCFEIQIENNELVFDYLLKDGVTHSMNATFLMKKMGIIDSSEENNQD